MTGFVRRQKTLTDMHNQLGTDRDSGDFRHRINTEIAAQLELSKKLQVELEDMNNLSVNYKLEVSAVPDLAAREERQVQCVHEQVHRTHRQVPGHLKAHQGKGTGLHRPCCEVKVSLALLTH